MDWISDATKIFRLVLRNMELNVKILTTIIPGKKAMKAGIIFQNGCLNRLTSSGD